MRARRPDSFARRRRGSALALLALAAPFAACAARPAASAISPASAARPGGSLFSTIPCAQTPLGRAWARLRPEAAARFPGLELTRVEDLHVTVVYVGPGWQKEALAPTRALALVAPRESFASRPEITRLGETAHVLVAELRDAPATWLADVAAAKAEMNRLGLKKSDRYDAQFRPHVTLASAKSRPPGPAEAEALGALLAWLRTEVAVGPDAWIVPLGPRSPVRFWLAGLERPEDAPEYVDLEALESER